jgi:hypothetical protein
VKKASIPDDQPTWVIVKTWAEIGFDEYGALILRTSSPHILIRPSNKDLPYSISEIEQGIRLEAGQPMRVTYKIAVFLVDADPDTFEIIGQV